MPHPTVLLRILRASAPAAVRLIALATVALGRPPLHHNEAGVSRASWYRHRGDAAALVSHAEKNQARPTSRRETNRATSRPTVDNLGQKSPGVARPKSTCAQGVTTQSPRNRHLSTPQKRNKGPNQSRKGRANAPFGSARERLPEPRPRRAGVDVRASVERFRRAWLKARERNRDVQYLSLSHDALGTLARRLEADGAERVEAVVLFALGQAERGEIAPAWWSRIFYGEGYAARAISYDAHLKRQAEIKRRAARPVTETERGILELFGKVGAL